MKYPVIAIAIPVALCIFLYAQVTAPSVSLVRSPGSVTVHCELLGEYPSDVERIEITEKQTGRTIWRVKALGAMFQLHTFDLVSGMNSGILKPSHGQYQSEIPAGGPFYLRSGVSYRAAVCSPGWLGQCRATEFIL